MAFFAPIGCVRFARYCGKMYSRHLLGYGRFCLEAYILGKVAIQVKVGSVDISSLAIYRGNTGGSKVWRFFFGGEGCRTVICLDSSEAHCGRW